MQKEQISGLRLFLYGVLELIKNQKSETCSFINSNLSSGIATALFNKYQTEFEHIHFNRDNIENVDDYYKTVIGVADGKINQYSCDENDGLYLVIKLALNEIF